MFTSNAYVSIDFFLLLLVELLFSFEKSKGGIFTEGIDFFLLSKDLSI